MKKIRVTFGSLVGVRNIHKFVSFYTRGWFLNNIIIIKVCPTFMDALRPMHKLLLLNRPKYGIKSIISNF